MVNLTYGILIPNPDGTYTMDVKGTDIISTLKGETSGALQPIIKRTPPTDPPTVYDPGDIAWVLTCAALIILMVRIPSSSDHPRRPPSFRH